MKLFFALLAGGLSALAANAQNILLLSYFRDNGETGVYLAWSTNGVQFAALNGDKPVFAPPSWPDQNLTRDTSIVFNEGKFHAVWTSGWKGRFFGYSESSDLVHWSEPVKVQPFPDSLAAEDQPRNIWAPEIHWDPVQQDYLILWSSTTERESRNGDGSSMSGKDGDLDHRFYISRTRDGKTFSPARLFFDPKFCCIDGMMVFDPAGGKSLFDARWILVLKNEQEVKLGGKNLRLSFAPSDFSKWSPVSAPIVGPGSTIRPNEMAEGPSLLSWNGQWLLYWDAFANGHYAMASSTNLTQWQDKTAELQLPPHPRHGTVFKAPKAAVGWLK